MASAGKDKTQQQKQGRFSKQHVVSKKTIERKMMSEKRKQMSIRSFFSSSSNDASKNLEQDSTKNACRNNESTLETPSLPSGPLHTTSCSSSPTPWSTPPTPTQEAKGGFLRTPETPPSPRDILLGTPDTVNSNSPNLTTPPSTTITTAIEKGQRGAFSSAKNEEKVRNKTSATTTTIFNNSNCDDGVTKFHHNASTKSRKRKETSTSITTTTFMGTPTSSVSSLASSSSRMTSQKTMKRKAFQQMYLDLGQENFGKQTICSTCGMLFVHGLSEDSKEHQRICTDHLKGVPFPQNPLVRTVATFPRSSFKSTATPASAISALKKAGHIISSSSKRIRNRSSSSSNNNNSENDYIVEIRPTDSHALRQKVSRVKAIVDQELGFFSSTTTNHNNQSEQSRGAIVDESRVPSTRTAYLYVSNKRVVGMVTAEIITKAYCLLTNNFDTNKTTTNPTNRSNSNSGISATYSLERSHIPSKAIVGIHQLWVHSKSRQCGIATKLVDTARSKMVFGFVVPQELVAFSSPTEAGAKFARNYMEKATLPFPPNSNTDHQDPLRNQNPSPYPPVLVYDCK